MKFNIRKLEASDWGTLVKWWDSWPEWVAPPKTFLPENGTGGLIVEKDEQPVVAGFLYFTNSQAVLLEPPLILASSTNQSSSSISL